MIVFPRENTRHLIENMSISELEAKHIITQLVSHFPYLLFLIKCGSTSPFSLHFQFPDAPFIGEGKLIQKDIENENRYLHYLFLCVRGGDLQRVLRYFFLFFFAFCLSLTL